MIVTGDKSNRYFGFAMLVCALAGIWAMRLYSYLLFHCFVETFTIVISCSIFITVWNAEYFSVNGYFLFIAAGFLFVGFWDFLHMLAYDGMGVFRTNGPDIATQFWVIGRCFQAGALLGGFAFVRRKVRMDVTVTAFALVSAAFLALPLTVTTPSVVSTLVLIALVAR